MKNPEYLVFFDNESVWPPYKIFSTKEKAIKEIERYLGPDSPGNPEEIFIFKGIEIPFKTQVTLLEEEGGKEVDFPAIDKGCI